MRANRLPITVLVVFVGITMCHRLVGRAQETESYLTSPLGPYRGQVLELLTEKPLAGAVVVMAWESDRNGDGLRRVFAAKEAVTDSAGRFLVDASVIESSLPPRAFPPGLLVYKPGYVTMPRERGRRFGAPATRFAGLGASVQIKPVRDEEERAEAFNVVIYSVGDLSQAMGDPVGTRLFPQTARIVAEELHHFQQEATREAGKIRP